MRTTRYIVSFRTFYNPVFEDFSHLNEGRLEIGDILNSKSLNVDGVFGESQIYELQKRSVILNFRKLLEAS